MSGRAPSRRPGGELEIVSAERWLVVHLGGEHDVASWAIVGGGLRRARGVAWHEVANHELGPLVDARELLRSRLEAQGQGDAVGLLTSRDIRSFVDVTRRHGDAWARCIATVGLSNALRAGDPPGSAGRIGTINALCVTSTALRTEALLEALALAAEARTVAVLEAGVTSTVSGAPASGTGTDCLVIAAPADGPAVPYAGKHTAIGHVIGGAVHDAVARGVADWKREHGR